MFSSQSSKASRRAAKHGLEDEIKAATAAAAAAAAAAALLPPVEKRSHKKKKGSGKSQP